MYHLIVLLLIGLQEMFHTFFKLQLISAMIVTTSMNVTVENTQWNPTGLLRFWFSVLVLNVGGWETTSNWVFDWFRLCFSGTACWWLQSYRMKKLVDVKVLKPDPIFLLILGDLLFLVTNFDIMGRIKNQCLNMTSHRSFLKIYIIFHFTICFDMF